MKTALNLLTRDGLLYMAFAPHLTPAQYTELLEMSEIATNRKQLRELVSRWAKDKGLRVSFDEAKDPETPKAATP